MHAPIPAEGEAVSRTRIADVWDKGKAAVIVQESKALAPDGTALYTTRSSIFARGEGGFGGERGPSGKVEVAAREPDAVIETPTLPQQAYLYRLCGDRNPLHADPEFAQLAGFDQPYRETAVTLEPGETLVLYTDGLTEARGPGGEFYGAERLREVVRDAPADVEALGSAILADERQFAAGRPQRDDLTLVCVGREG